MNIIHKKGSHSSKPFILNINWKASSQEMKFKFTDSCRYVIEGEDQWDWNKLTGYSFNLLDARKDSVMCGWRYNPTTQRVELCLYAHVDGSFNPPSVYLCTVEIDEVFTLRFDFNENIKEASLWITNKETTYCAKTNFRKFGINRQINTWFGGTSSAPQDITIIKL